MRHDHRPLGLVIVVYEHMFDPVRDVERRLVTSIECRIDAV